MPISTGQGGLVGGYSACAAIQRAKQDARVGKAHGDVNLPLLSKATRDQWDISSTGHRPVGCICQHQLNQAVAAHARDGSLQVGVGDPQGFFVPPPKQPAGWRREAVPPTGWSAPGTGSEQGCSFTQCLLVRASIDLLKQCSSAQSHVLCALASKWHIRQLRSCVAATCPGAGWAMLQPSGQTLCKATFSLLPLLSLPVEADGLGKKGWVGGWGRRDV